MQPSNMIANESIDILRQKMEPRGFVFQDIRLGLPVRNYTRILSPGGNMVIVSSGSPLYPFATSSSRTIYRNKHRAYDLAKSLGLQVPLTLTVSVSEFSKRYSEIEQFLKTNSPVIVKPDSSSGSQGLSLDITTMAELEQAVQLAGNSSDSILIQKQFDGEELRFAVIGGKVRAVLLRQKAMVVGDGQSSLRQLIDQENETRTQLTDTVVPYPRLDATNIDKGLLTDDRIVPSGERVELSKGTMIRTGASMYNVTDQVNRDYIAIVERFASQFGPGFLAIDIMVDNYVANAHGDNYVILEVNTNPALSLFYSCRDGKHVEIVEKYLCDAFQHAMDGWKV